MTSSARVLANIRTGMLGFYSAFESLAGRQ